MINQIQYSNKPDLQEKGRGRMTLLFRKIEVDYSEETSSDQQRSPAHPMSFKIQTDTTIASALTEILILNSQNLRIEKCPKYKKPIDQNSCSKVDEVGCINLMLKTHMPKQNSF